MEPNKIAELLASGDKEQIKAAQRQLQSLGYYRGSIDGILKNSKGESATLDAVGSYRNDYAANAPSRNAEVANTNADAKVKGAQAEGIAAEAALTKAKADEEARKIKAREARAKDAESIGGITAQTLAGAPAALTGVWAGREMGKGVNYYMDESQKSKNKVLAGLADDRRAGLTTTKGARTAARLAGAMPSENSVLRVGGRMLPHAGLGGFMLGKGGLMLSQEDPEGPHYPEMVNRGAALGMIGAGTGIAERGLLYGVAPGEVPDAKSLAVIESDQLRRKPGPAAGPSAGSKAALMADAKAAGVKGVSKMNKGQIAAALANVTRKIPALAGPGVAASLAYGMSPDEAQAADGSGGGDSQALTNAALAGGGYAGARAVAPSVAQSLAGSTLAKYAAPVASGIGRVAARAAGPFGIGLTAYDAVRGINDLAHMSPPQDPSQYSTMGGFMPPGMGQGQPAPAPQGAPPQNPMMNAAALPMPQNAPPDATQQANIASEFDPAMRGPQQADLGLPPEMQGQIQMLSQQGVPPELIANYLNMMAAQQGAL